MELVGMTILQLLLMLGAISQPAAASSGDVVSEAYVGADTSTALFAGCGMIKCTSDFHAEPQDTREVSELIKKLQSEASERGDVLKVRATRRGFHTPSGFTCAGATRVTKLPAEEENEVSTSGSGKKSTTVTVLMHRMNRIVNVDSERLRLTVEAGMTLQNLADAATGNGLSVPVGVLPVYGNLTVGGVLSTAAHGTGLGVTNSLIELVTGAKWVNGRGEVITSEVEDEKGLTEIRALMGGVGLLGIVTEVTFQFLPENAMAEVEIWNDLDDANISTDLLNFLQAETPHILTFWRPDLKRFRMFLYKPVEREQSAEDLLRHPLHPKGRSVMLAPSDGSVGSVMKPHMAAYTADVDDSSPNADSQNELGCALSLNAMNLRIFGDGEQVFDNATIPSSHAMIAEECSPNCIWDPKFFGATVEDSEFAIRVSQLDDWVRDVKAIVEADEGERLRHLHMRFGEGKVKTCLPPGFIWLRFGQGSRFTTAMTAGLDEPVLYAMVSFWNSVLTPHQSSKMDSINEAIEQLSLCKYGGRPHWGKNFPRAFVHPKCHVRDNYPAENIALMLELQQQHDPLKIFEAELLSRVLERRGPKYADKCALSRTCYCVEDAHCAQGLKCQPSSVFPEYKVCRIQYPSHHLDSARHEEL